MNQKLKQQLYRQVLSLVTCLGAFGLASAQPAQSTQGWRFDYPAQPGTSGRTICVGAGCRQAQAAQNAKLLKACLYRELWLAEYRARFDSMQGVAAIEAFIADYQGDDPDGKIGLAKVRLEEAQRTAQAQAQAQAAEKAAQQKAKSLADKEREIAFCHRETERAEKTIAREQEVGRMSGYVNKMTLREAGGLIVFCQERVPKTYAEYKRLGGTKSLNELR